MFSSHPLWQFARFGVVGGALTALVALVYLAAINFTSLTPAVALTGATLIASAAGYFAHSAISFRGHGKRDRVGMRITRFLTTNSIGFLANLLFVIVLVDLAHLPEWTPTIPFCLVTPMLTFVLNRKWVFG